MLNHSEDFGVCSSLITDFVTFDIESIVINNNITSYLIIAYNGTNYIESFGLNQNELFTNFINQLLTFFTNDSNIITVYAHNLSGFDGILLLKHLLSYGKVKPLLFNGKLMSIKLKLNVEGHKNKTIIFKDSYQLLPLSLRKLCEAFNIQIGKGYFPFLLNDIFYKGVLPKLEYWTGITLKEYELFLKEYANITWNFRDESIKYCKLDCKCLFEILVHFNELIFKHFRVNIDYSLTLPALAMRIYKSQFMPKNTIYQLLGNIERDIRESYTGGAVDVYIPHNRITPWLSSNININYEKIKCYDVNSLYPTVMSTKSMPIGKPIAFQGDIRVVEQDAFGFFYCEITSPANLLHPILQRKINTVNGIRTIAGLGSWSAWITSSEMDNAMKFGYTFKIIKGYQFDKGDIFSKMVNKCYNLRLQYPKGHPMNNIAKLLMNSLYGKFGMKEEITIIEVLNNLNDIDKEIISNKLELYNNNITDIINLVDHILLIRKSFSYLAYNKKEDIFHGTEVNVAIASAITAEARIHMSLFKNNPDFKLYYSDTDSVVINKPLPESMVGNNLGQLKLEYTIKKAVFLAPKVYALITNEGKEIIKVKGLSHKVISKLNFLDLEAL